GGVRAAPRGPKNRNLPSRGRGGRGSNGAEPSGAPKPDVITVPNTWQNSGLAPLAGMSTAETIVTFAPPSPASAAGLHLGSAALPGAAPISRLANDSPAADNLWFESMMFPPSEMALLWSRLSGTAGITAMKQDSGV